MKRRSVLDNQEYAELKSKAYYLAIELLGCFSVVLMLSILAYVGLSI